jgi:glycosyltransferase involved in cell wall biosynthesis
MRLVVVSHACVTPVNQAFFGAVQRVSGWDVTVVLPRAWRNEYGRQEARRSDSFDGALEPLPVLLKGNIPLHVYGARVGRVFRRLAPDAVYVHHEPYGLATAQAFRAALRAGASAVGFYSAQNLEKRFPLPVARLESWVFRHAAFAFPVSERVEQVLRAKRYRGRSHVLPLWVEPRSSGAGQPRDGRPSARVGYVGRLAEEKGIDTLLDALSRLDDVDVRGVVAGEGPERGALEQRARGLRIEDRVEWLGYVPHDRVQSVYDDLDLVVVPSRTVPNWTEQFGRVVIEALSAGVPVVTSDSGELPNLVAQTGGGWTFPEGSPDALADTIRSVLGDPARLREAALRGHAAVRERYDVEIVAGQFVDVVREAVASARPPDASSS